MRSATTADTSLTDPLADVLLDDRRPSEWPAAFAALRSRAEAGKAAADQWLVGHCLQRGRGAPVDLLTAAEFLRLGAHQKLAEAECALGLTLLKGLGFAANHPKGLLYLGRASAQGYGPAQFHLALCRDAGLGVELVETLSNTTLNGQDEVEAARYFRLAADQGVPGAQARLAECLRIGRGVPRDEAEAARYRQLAAAHDPPAAPNDPGELGALLADEASRRQAEIEAAAALRLAADQGHAEAQYRLGVCLSKGRGVPLDLAEAATCFERAADQETSEAIQHWNYDALLAWARCLAGGLGVPRNEARAEIYEQRAASVLRRLWD